MMTARRVTFVMTSLGLLVKEVVNPSTVADDDAPAHTSVQKRASKQQVEEQITEKFELEFLALSLFERGHLSYTYFDVNNEKRNELTQEIAEGMPVNNILSTKAFFQVGGLASKTIRLYMKNLAGNYVVRLFRGPLGTIVTQACSSFFSLFFPPRSHPPPLIARAHRWRELLSKMP